MRIINVIVFIAWGGVVLIAKLLSKRESERGEQCRQFVAKHWHLFLLLFIANSISFAMTFMVKEEAIFVERDGYGGDAKEFSVLFTKGEEQEEWKMPIYAKRLTEEELQERVAGAFLYLEKNLQGENSSLKEVRSNLDYSLDYEEFPFDADFVADHFSLIDEEGIVKNEEQELLELGYSEHDLKAGIPVVLEVTLWYEDQSFSKEYGITVFPKDKSEVEEAFSLVKKELEAQEKETAYEDGFYLPAKVGEVEISVLDEEGVTPAQVLIAGFILMALLFLREQENTKKLIQNRRECLVRSYPWFVNELLLMMGAGMQMRNIFALLIRDYEDVSDSSDYRKPLIEEIKMAVQAMELGMTEEQVYYKLGRRLELPCYIKIMTMLEQNVKRGGKGIGLVFEQEELQALEERKNLAKRLGEEAGTKLLGPMILLLLIIMLMIMLPAFWGFA